MALTRGTATSSNAASASSLTFACDVGTGDRRGIVVLVRVDDSGSSGATVSTVTYNGVSCAQKVSETHTYAGTAKIIGEAWALTNPASGSNNVVVTLSTSVAEVSAIAVPYTDYGGLGANTGVESGNLSSFSITFTTGASTSEMLATVAHANPRTVTGGGATLITSADSDQQHALYEAATGGSDTIDWTESSSTRSSAVAVEVTQDLGGGGGSLPPRGVVRPQFHFSRKVI